MASAVLKVVCLFVVLELAASLKCSGICRPQDCRPPKYCPYGHVPDSCKCCRVCGKGPGEECGGFQNLAGSCGRGLKCVVVYEPGVNYIVEPTGTCKRVS